MTVQPIRPVAFGYRHEIKTLFKRGQLPIKYDLYGGELTQNNVTLEHLTPKSQGGCTQLKNLALCTRKNNIFRGTRPLNEVLEPKTAKQYLDQFDRLRIGLVSGKTYKKMIIKTLKKLGVDIEEL